MTSQNLVKQIDLTGLTEVTASQIMQLLETALFANDKGIIIETQDTGIGIPDVPDPTQGELEGVDVEFWTRFEWVRKPHADAGPEAIVYHYFWNPLKAADATLLQWETPYTAIELAQSTANDAVADAATAVEQANTATTLAQTVEAVANSAQTLATANEAAITVLDGRVDAAETTITNHETRITALEAGSSEEEDPVTPSSLGLSKAPVDFAFLKEVQASGTQGGTFNSGAWVTRTLNQENQVGATGITLNADNSFSLIRGTYLIEAEAPAFGVERHQAKLYNESTGTDVAFGSSSYAGDSTVASIQSVSKINAIVTITSTQDFSIMHKCETSQANNGLGEPASLGSEVYTQVKITKLYS